MSLSRIFVQIFALTGPLLLGGVDLGGLDASAHQMATACQG